MYRLMSKLHVAPDYLPRPLFIAAKESLLFYPRSLPWVCSAEMNVYLDDESKITVHKDSFFDF